MNAARLIYHQHRGRDVYPLQFEAYVFGADYHLFIETTFNNQLWALIHFFHQLWVVFYQIRSFFPVIRSEH